MRRNRIWLLIGALFPGFLALQPALAAERTVELRVPGCA